MNGPWRIPLSDVEYGPEERRALRRVVDSRWLSMGAEVAAFEKEFARFLGVRHAVAVSNATAALHLSLLAVGVGPGDDVVQPALNFVAAANVTRAVGARPVFADVIGPTEPTLDPRDVEKKITRKTKAVVVMHYGGRPGPMADLNALCRRRGLVLVEDACHALGARYADERGRFPHGRRVGALADAACFSFFSNKNMTTGEGGMITTDDEKTASRARLLRSHGMTTMTWDRHRGHARSYDVLVHGFNYRMDEMRAALGRAQLKKLPAFNAQRARWARLYHGRVSRWPGWGVLVPGRPGESAHHLMVVVAPDERSREAALVALRRARVQTSLHYPPVADFTAFRSRPTAGLARTRAFARRAITLPLFPGLGRRGVNAVCDVLERTFRG